MEYTVTKIHKKDVQLRQIVSVINSLTYNLERHLAGVLKAKSGKISSNTKNSTLFVEKMQ